MHTTASFASSLPDIEDGYPSRELSFIDWSQLSLNPSRIEPFLMQNCTHSVPKTMSSSLSRIPNPLEHLINTRFVPRFARIITPRKHQRKLPRHHFELLYDLQRLGRKGDKVRLFHLHSLGRNFPHRFLKI